MSTSEIPEAIQFVASRKRDCIDLDYVHCACPSLLHSHTDVLRDDTRRDVLSPLRLYIPFP